MSKQDAQRIMPEMGAIRVKRKEGIKGGKAQELRAQESLNLKDERIQSPCPSTKRKGGNKKNRKPGVYSFGEVK